MIFGKSFAADFVLLYFFPLFSLQVLVSVYCPECVSVGTEIHRAEKKPEQRIVRHVARVAYPFGTGAGTL